MSADDPDREIWDLVVSDDTNKSKLKTAADVAEFADAYHDFYAFIRDTPEEILDPSFRQVRAWAVAIADFVKLVEAVKKDPVRKPEVARWLTNRRPSKLPFHTSVAAQSIKRIWHERGAAVGAPAAMFAVGSFEMTNWASQSFATGAIAFASAHLIADGSGLSDFEAMVRGLKTKYDRALSNLSKQAEEAEGRQTNAELQFQLHGTELSNWVLNAIQNHSTALQSAADAAEEKQRLTLQTFNELMKLKAPVAYWSDKAIEHQKRQWTFGIASALWFVGGGISTGCFVWFLFETAVSKSGTPEAQGVPITLLTSLGALGLLATTVFLWISRIVVRLFLSEVHLTMDAQERAVMVQSYLALSNEGAIETEHRAIILSALFRSTQDGIVKDDAAADPTLIGLLNQIRKS